MTKTGWDDYKKSITNLTEDQLKVLETEAKKIADTLNKKDAEEADN